MVHQKNVRVFLRGGLGNQLFQYAAGLVLSERTGSELVIDPRLLPIVSHDKDGVIHRPEEISSFQHRGTIYRSPQNSVTRNQNFARLLQLERMVGDAFGTVALKILGSVASESRDLRGYFSTLKKPARINSYCGHPDFFSSNESDLRKQISALSNPSEFFLKNQARLDAEKPTGIHLRLGDYKNFENVYGKLTSKYFENGLVESSHDDTNHELWVFSDEPEKAKEVLGWRFRHAYYVPNYPSARPLESMILLSKMRRKVLSNSTFSWWAAFLGYPEQECTVFPRPMFGKDGPIEQEGFLLDGWHQIDR
jgi:hypothetical protein